MGEHLPRILCQQAQQLVFDRGEVDFGVTDVYTAGGIVNFQPAVDINTLSSPAAPSVWLRRSATRSRARNSSMLNGLVR